MLQDLKEYISFSFPDYLNLSWKLTKFQEENYVKGFVYYLPILLFLHSFNLTIRELEIDKIFGGKLRKRLGICCIVDIIQDTFANWAWNHHFFQREQIKKIKIIFRK